MQFLTKTFNLLDRAIALIEKIFLGISVLTTFGMMLFITADVVGRAVFNHPIIGCVEITEDYLMVAVFFLAMSYVYITGGHARITMLQRHFPPKIKLAVEVFSGLVCLIFFGLITYGGWVTTKRAFLFHEYSSSLLAYPLAPAYLLVVLGSGLLCLRILQAVFVPGRIKWEDE